MLFFCNSTEGCGLIRRGGILSYREKGYNLHFHEGILEKAIWHWRIEIRYKATNEFDQKSY